MTDYEQYQAWKAKQNKPSNAPLWIMLALMTLVAIGVGVYLYLPLPQSSNSGATTQSEAKQQPTRFVVQDRGADSPAHQPDTLALATPAPPANNATAEARSKVQYDATIATPVPADYTPAWAAELPSCASGKRPCVFSYSTGPHDDSEQPNLASGGTNTGSDGNPQKDTDQAASFNGDKP